MNIVKAYNLIEKIDNTKIYDNLAAAEKDCQDLLESHGPDGRRHICVKKRFGYCYGIIRARFKKENGQKNWFLKFEPSYLVPYYEVSEARELLETTKENAKILANLSDRGAFLGIFSEKV